MSFAVRDRRFDSGTHVMGIINVTPDSFFAASRAAADEAAERAVRMVRDGAAIIDIGAQSTRPGAREVSSLEEMSLLLPALEKVRAATDAPVSVDTFYPEVAEAALAAGADMINDVSCLRFPGMAETAARYGASLCIMHDRRGSKVKDLMTDKLTGLGAAVRKALRAGVRAEKILLDGGIGFNLSPKRTFSLRSTTTCSPRRAIRCSWARRENPSSAENPRPVSPPHWNARQGRRGWESFSCACTT